MGWWDFAVRAFSLLTKPEVDVAAVDRDVEALARQSVVGGTLHGTSAAIRRAWAASRTRSTLDALSKILTGFQGADAWRVGGWMVVVTGATVLVINPLATLDAGPLIWVTPALLVVTGIFVMACAAPLARASADRRRRSSSTQ